MMSKQSSSRTLPINSSSTLSPVMECERLVVGNQLLTLWCLLLRTSLEVWKKKEKKKRRICCCPCILLRNSLYCSIFQKIAAAKFFDVWNLTSTCTTSSLGRTNFLWMQQRRDYIIQFLQRSVINAYEITRWLRRGIYEKSLFHNNPLLSHLSDAATNSKLKLSTYDLISGV